MVKYWKENKKWALIKNQSQYNYIASLNYCYCSKRKPVDCVHYIQCFGGGELISVDCALYTQLTYKNKKKIGFACKF